LDSSLGGTDLKIDFYPSKNSIRAGSVPVPTAILDSNALKRTFGFETKAVNIGCWGRLIRNPQAHVPPSPTATCWLQLAYQRRDN